jgi:DNA-binding beta-propeller fold protein YncE
MPGSLIAARFRLLLGFMICLTASLPASLMAVEPPLILETMIPLEGVRGRIDHMAIDLSRKRLLVAELGNGTVDVVDLAQAKVTHRIDGLKEPQGVAYIPGLDLICVSGAGDGSVRFFRAGDYAAAGVISLGDDADNIRVDPATGQVIVGYGSGGLAIIDPASRKKLRDIPLPSHPEGFQIDPASTRVFVNVPDARQIAVVDRLSAEPLATWRQKDLKSNFPLALDGIGKTVASVFRGSSRLLLFDADTGAVIASVETCGDADDLFFDDGREQIYVSCGAGMVDVFQREAAEVRRSGRISTAHGARTSLFVPELDSLFVAEPAGWRGDTAKLLVYKPRLIPAP